MWCVESHHAKSPHRLTVSIAKVKVQMRFVRAPLPSDWEQCMYSTIAFLFISSTCSNIFRALPLGLRILASAFTNAVPVTDKCDHRSSTYNLAFWKEPVPPGVIDMWSSNAWLRSECAKISLQRDITTRSLGQGLNLSFIWRNVHLVMTLSCALYILNLFSLISLIPLRTRT